MKKPYEPSFLISAKVPRELQKQLVKCAQQLGVSEEEVCRKAVKFFAVHCVHTQGGRKGKKSAR